MVDNLLGAFPRESVWLVLDILKDPSITAPFAQLMTRLLASHELTDFYQNEKLHHLGDLGQQEPLVLCARMLKLCLHDHKTNRFLLFLFLQRLPAKLRDDSWELEVMG
jgi:hypothetical protein